MDRAGANPVRIIQDIKRKLGLNAAAVQIAIGSESTFQGVVDLVKMRAIYNTGEQGVNIETGPIPEDLIELAKEKRSELVAAVAEVDEAMSEFFIDEIDPPLLVLLVNTHKIGTNRGDSKNYIIADVCTSIPWIRISQQISTATT
jgi:elongation factor G